MWHKTLSLWPGEYAFWGYTRPLREASDDPVEPGFSWLGKWLDNAGRHSAHTKTNRFGHVKGLWRPACGVGHFFSKPLWRNHHPPTKPPLIFPHRTLTLRLAFVIRNVLNHAVILQICTAFNICCLFSGVDCGKLWRWCPGGETLVMWEQLSNLCVAPLKKQTHRLICWPLG